MVGPPFARPPLARPLIESSKMTPTMPGDSRSSWRPLLFDPLAWWLSRRELARLREAAGKEVEAVVDATEAYQGRGFYARIHAVQNRDEIVRLANQVQQLDPKVVVEIGTYKGGTLWIWCRVAQPELVASIDLPGGAYGGGYDRRRERLYRQFLVDRPHATMSFLRADSHEANTAAQLKASLAGRAIDFLYIDGDHSYAGVTADFHLYEPLVRVGGLVAFHDIATRTADHEVWRFWEELRSRYPDQTEELLAPGHHNKGLGLFWKKA